MEYVTATLFSPYIDECYIDYSAMRHPANTWISVHTQANDTKYLISDCPIWIIVYHTLQILTYFILIYSVSLIGLVSCVHSVNIISVWHLDHQGV